MIQKLKKKEKKCYPMSRPAFLLKMMWFMYNEPHLPVTVAGLVATIYPLTVTNCHKLFPSLVFQLQGGAFLQGFSYPQSWAKSSTLLPVRISRMLQMPSLILESSSPPSTSSLSRTEPCKEISYIHRNCVHHHPK